MAYKNAIMCDDETLVNSFKRALELGAMPTVHAENGELVFLLQKDVAKGITGPEGHPLSRPPAVEAKPPTAPSHCRRAERADLRRACVVHRSAAAIARARARGQRCLRRGAGRPPGASTTACTATRLRHAAAHVMSPPFRPKGTRSAVARPAGRAPAHHRHRPLHLLRRRKRPAGKDDFSQDPQRLRRRGGAHGGAVGRRREHRRLTPSEFVAVTSANAAKLFNIYPRKGCVAPGADADLVVWDPQARKTLSAKTQHSKGDFNIFEGRTVRGIPSHT
jgi:dihydropyrimidinase